MATKYLETGL